MVRKVGKNGAFLACNQYPGCRHTQDDDGSVRDEPVKIEPPKPAVKEFHLSPEEVKARALECAIKSCTQAQLMETGDVIELAMTYEKYIVGY